MRLIDLAYLAVYAIMLYCSVLWFAVFLVNRRVVRKTPRPKKFPSITFLVPVYNGEKYVTRCIDGLLGLKYPGPLHIIVIDDGSTDRSARLVRAYPQVRLIRQRHAGKAAALNRGLRHVQTELVACMDVDSVPASNYLLRAVGYFARPDVAVVTPALKVSHTDSLMRQMQWTEYLFQIFLRKTFSLFDCQYVVPGPGGIYRTAVLREVGGFDEGNLTEDTEIAFRIIDRGWKLENSIDAFVYTHTPPGLRGLWKQRIRWYRGYLQNVRKYAHMIANPRYGNLGLFLLPINFVWIGILGFLFFALIHRLVSSVLTALINWAAIGFAILPPQFTPSLMWVDLYTFFALTFLATSLLTVGLSVVYSGEQFRLRKRLTSYVMFLFVYPLLISIFWIVATVYELMGVRRRW
jgi:cellulose synthase/poly-beta-1,6-N-acetylglucosamine synthase-like glycosyltransferase